MGKNRYAQFRKKDLVGIYNYIIDFCLRKFGYSKRPHLVETRLIDGALACMVTHNNEYAIMYDYKQFRDSYKDMTYEDCEMLALSIIAHEMRHYYQVRQIFSKTPRENEKTLAEWRRDYFNGKVLGDDGCDSFFEYFTQSLELDAELYAYVFVGKILDKVPIYPDKEYVKELRKKYVEIFGEGDEYLYIFDEVISDNQV
jgi:hypothetical protein